MDKKYFCILGGGGIRGAAYVGALKAIEELGLEITGFAGSSIGAVVAGLVTFGYSTEEIRTVFDNIDFDFFKDINLNFGKDFAISKGKNFYEWIKNRIEEKYYANSKEDEIKPPVRFKDTDKELVIFTVDLATSKLYEFSKEKTPDAEIAQAIRISAAMPGLYAPFFNENECLVDGDLLKSMPLWKVSDTITSKKEKILEYRLENNETKKKITNTFEYLNAVYDSVSGIASDFVIDTYKDCDRYDYIKINTENVSVVDFMMNKEKKKELAKTGYQATINYFKNSCLKKSEKLTALYKKIYDEFKIILFLAENKEFDEARYEIANVFSVILPDVKIIDKEILNIIIETKNVFDANYIVKKALIGQKAALIDYRKTIGSIKTAVDKINLKLNGSFVV